MVTVYFVTDYPEMERETQMRIRGTFDQLLEEYDPTTGVETLGKSFHPRLGKKPGYPGFGQIQSLKYEITGLGQF